MMWRGRARRWRRISCSVLGAADGGARGIRRDAIYVAIRAYDDEPELIASQLARRDATGIFSDWVDVIIDSFHDRRTAYRFSVNPHGVKKDVFHYNDNQEDLGWDAVWDVATRIDEDGWTAEFRIPLSQLRYAADDGEQTWGVQFGRTIARLEESSFWAPVLPNDGGFVSRAGTLTGIERSRVAEAARGAAVHGRHRDALAGAALGRDEPVLSGPIPE
jgi:hypothetical protein